jgi:hypothetical protein
MGLRCSLFGHTFTETDARRDREVRGDEVVTVVKTVERCSNCGAERVVSENKEVVSVVDADDVEEPEARTDETGAGNEAEAAVDADAEDGPDEESTPTDGAAATDEPATDAGGEAGAEDGADDEESATAPDLDPDADPEAEDVEFITETDGSLGGGDEVDVDIDEEAPEGGIGGMAARSGAYGDPDEASGASDPVPDTGDEAADEDAEILGEAEQRGDRAPGQWPDDPDATDEPWEPGELGGGPGTEPEPDDEVAEPAPVDPSPAPSSGPAAESATDSLHCPACGHTVSTEGSYRAGDACPECHGDYLEAPSE